LLELRTAQLYFPFMDMDALLNHKQMSA